MEVTRAVIALRRRLRKTKITVGDERRAGNRTVTASHRNPLATWVTAWRGNISLGKLSEMGASNMGRRATTGGVIAWETARRRHIEHGCAQGRLVIAFGKPGAKIGLSSSSNP
jgi:hypothetical protein